MLYPIAIVLLYVIFAVTACVISLLLLNICFAWARLRQRGPDRPGYWEFAGRHVSGRSLKFVFVWIPLGLFAVIVCTLLAIAPWQQCRLSGLGDSSTLRVRTGGHCHRDTPREQVLFETHQPAQIAELLTTIRFSMTGPSMQCMCCGDVSFEFYRAGELVRSFSLHHGQGVRFKGAGYDITLTSTSQRNLEGWLKQTGVQGKLEEFQRTQSGGE